MGGVKRAVGGDFIHERRSDVGRETKKKQERRERGKKNVVAEVGECWTEVGMEGCGDAVKTLLGCFSFFLCVRGRVMKLMETIRIWKRKRKLHGMRIMRTWHW